MTNRIKSEYSKYWEEYTPSDLEKNYVKNNLWDGNFESNETRKNIADDRYDAMKLYKGDAMYEVIKGEEYSYYEMDTLAFSSHGGSWLSETNAGIFAYNSTSGSAVKDSGFRCILL